MTQLVSWVDLVDQADQVADHQWPTREVDRHSGGPTMSLPTRGEEPQGFSKVKHSKSQNGFFTMSSLELNIFGTISTFQIR